MLLEAIPQNLKVPRNFALYSIDSREHIGGVPQDPLTIQVRVGLPDRVKIPAHV